MPLSNPLIKESNYQKAIFIFLATTLVSAAFGVRIVNSISITLLVALTLIHTQRIKFIKRAFLNPYFICCLLLLSIKALGLLYTHHMNDTLRQVSSKGIWIAIPFFFCANYFIKEKDMRKLMVFFTASLLIVSISCIIYATYTYYYQGNSSVFFYHELVKPFRQHAVVFSFYIFFCVIYWMEDILPLVRMRKFKLLITGILIYFLCLIFLLSSKLVIILSSCYALYFIFRRVFTSKREYGLFLGSLLFIGIISAVLLTNNPIKNRFSDATSGNTNLFRKEKFSPDIYFNGIQLRLLIWRFTAEILNEKNAWLEGVSSGDAQYELYRKYSEANIYLGDGSKDKKGYAAFNCHNVFLQTTLESGLIGLIILLALITTYLWQTIKAKRISTLIFFLSILAFCFTESVLSSQYTILLFMFFPLLSLNVRRT